MKTAIPLVLLLAATLSAQTATHIVPTHHATIQAAIQAAGTGDTVLVLPGTYNETVSFLGKAITVRSRDGAAVTTINGNHQGTVVSMSGSGAPILEGFTVTGGNGYLSGSTGYAGGISCSATGGIIRDNVITGNRISILPQPGSRGIGGGIYCSSGAPRILRNTITDNSCTGGWGGGISLSASGGTAVIKGNTINNNYGAWGGGIRAKGTAVIEENVISGNMVLEGRYNPDSRGGGLLCEGAVTLRNNLITSNRVVANLSGSGGGVYCKDLAGVISGNTIADNTAPSGGGICVTGTPAIITANTITGNTAEFAASSMPGGGGIYAYSALITSNLIAGNLSRSYGGGIAVPKNAILVNNTVSGNTAEKGGGGYYTWNSSPSTIVNSIFWNNTAPADPQIGGSTPPSVTWSDVQGGWTGTGNLALDPGFADPAAGDFHLVHASPCKEAGNPSATGLPSTDFEGDPRLVAGKVAMGADTFYPHLYHTGTPAPGSTIRVKIVGEPGEHVLWAYSITPTVYDPPVNLPGFGDFYLKAPFIPIFLGPVPSTGILSFPFSFTPTFPTPSTFPTQALVIGSSRMLLTDCDRVEVR